MANHAFEKINEAPAQNLDICILTKLSTQFCIDLRSHNLETQVFYYFIQYFSSFSIQTDNKMQRDQSYSFLHNIVL